VQNKFRFWSKPNYEANFIDPFSTRQLWRTHWSSIWLVSSFPSSSDFPIHVEPKSTKQKLDFDVHEPNPKIAKLWF
jgi:hypothetical protein